MAKLKLLEVTSFKGEPVIRAIVETTDPYEYIGQVRARFQQRLQGWVAMGNYSASEASDMMRKLKVNLYNINCDRYPNTPEEEAELFDRIDAVEDGVLEAT